MCSHLAIRVIHHDDFAAMSNEWDGLLARSQANTIFLTWEWLYTWWQHFGPARQLYVMLVEQDARLVGIAPFFREQTRIRGVLPVRTVDWLGTGAVGSDYLNIIAEPGYEERVVEAVCAEIVRNQREWDLLKLSGLPEHSISYQSFFTRFNSNEKFNCQAGIDYYCPYIELTGHTWNSFLESLSASVRYNLRRRNRQVFNKLGANVALCQQKTEIGRFLDAIFALHLRRWRQRGGSDGFCGASVRAFHQDVAERFFDRGWLRLYLLDIDGRAVAGIYGLEYGEIFSFYQSGFDPEWEQYSAGMVLLGHTIKDAITRNLTKYDFLHGQEEYKSKWTKRARHTCSLLVCPRMRLAPRLYFLMRTVKNRWALNSTKAVQT